MINDEPSLVTVAEFSTEQPAFLAAGMLENNGIAVTLDNPSMATLYGAGSTWAPIRLMVAAPDAHRAKELLRSHADC